MAGCSKDTALPIGRSAFTISTTCTMLTEKTEGKGSGKGRSKITERRGAQKENKRKEADDDTCTVYERSKVISVEDVRMGSSLEGVVVESLAIKDHVEIINKSATFTYLRSSIRRLEDTLQSLKDS
nr:hypothetical protein [Tanacetum cinerariifolium]GEZ42835.1 hypothetical protein [Tanacetum cinerariifolium]